MTREEEIRQAAEAYDTNNERYQYIFTEGAEWADSHRWHKASEELPKEKGEYLANIKGRPTYCMVWFDGWEFDNEPNVTHWMEIPELPKED